MVYTIGTQYRADGPSGYPIQVNRHALCRLSSVARGTRDGLVELRLSRGFSSLLKVIRPQKRVNSDTKFFSKKEPLANHCANWLLMLYYECRRLNGRGFPFGIVIAVSTPLILATSCG